MKVEDIWGVGMQYTKLLNKNRIFTALDLKNASEPWVRRHMTVVGHRMQMELRGIPCIELEYLNEPKKQIVRSLSFGSPVDNIEGLREAIIKHATRAAEKLREQNSVAAHISVFINTNPFRTDLPQYANFVGYYLPEPSAYTPVLIKHALNCLKRIYREGFRYIRAGVVLMDIRPEDEVQLNLFEPPRPIEEDKSLMKAVDSLNAKWGSNTVKYAGAGIRPKWSIKRARLSKRYTTNWDEMLVVKI
jgi:DNA polymerase V